MTSGYYRTSRPVTALPMITRWISDVPSKIVKIVDVRPVSAGRCPDNRPLVSTNSARLLTRTSRCLRSCSWRCIRPDAAAALERAGPAGISGGGAPTTMSFNVIVPTLGLALSRVELNMRGHRYGF
jgi:hypothetical protein